MTGSGFAGRSGSGARNDEHALFAFDDGPYVLGALDDEERADFEEHLAGCTICQQRISELHAMPDVLRRADPSVWAPEPPPETLLPRLLANVQAHRRRRRWRTATTGLVAACLLAALGVVAFRSLPGDDGPRVRVLQPLNAVGRQVRATVVLTKGTKGTSLRVTCDYAPKPPFPTGPVPTMYRLVLLNRMGEEQKPASWPPTATIQIMAMSSWPQQNIGRIEIEDEKGAILLRLDL